MLMAANGSSYGEREMSARKRDIRRRADASAPERRRWLARAAFFHDEDLLYLKFLIPEGARVLELGCGTGDLLAALKPSFGVGVDFSAGMIAEASKAHPELTFLVGDVEDPAFLRSLPGPFDFVVVVDTLGALEDCQAMFASLHELCTRQTRLVVGHFSHLWYPALKLAEATGMKMPQPPQNVLAPADVRALTVLGDFEAVKNETRVLVPLRLFGLGRLVNRFLAPLPLIRLFCLRHFTVCRSLRRPAEVRSASVVIPARNERGNIEAAVKRIPSFVEQLEIIFVEGHSKDGTWEEIERVAAAYPERNIKTMRQPGTGKGDAVFAGFDVAARGVHHEPVRTSADVLADGAPDPRRDPYASNQAIPTLLATRDRERFHRLFPALRIASVQWFALAAYPLSGGFQPWSLIGEGGARRLLWIERALEPMLGRLTGFRMLLVVEKAMGSER
jgi:SAM-dependent methyltransferase